MQAKAKHVVCIGGGHVNCQVLKILRTSLPEGTKLTLISEYPKSYYSGMLPGAVAGLYKPEQLQIPLSPLAVFCGADYIQQKVTKIDATKNTIHLQDGKTVGYDILGINIGSRTLGTYTVKGVYDYALTTRPIDELLPKILKIEQKFVDEKKIPNVIVVGGGAAGVELSFGFKQRWSKLFGQEIHVKQLVYEDDSLKNQTKSIRDLVREKQKEKKVDVRYGIKVVEVTPEGVKTEDGQFIEGNITVWATGPEPQGLTLDCEGLEISRGYFRVNDFMQSTTAPNVFAGGDCVTMKSYEKETRVFPGKAGVYAVRAGPIIAHNLAALAREKPEEYKEYVPQGEFLSLLMTGDHKAMGTKFGVSFCGKWVWEMKDWIDVGFMKLFQPQYLFEDYETLGTQKPRYDNKELFEQSAQDMNKKKQEAVEKAFAMTPEQGVASLRTSEEETEFLEPLMVVDRMAKDAEFKEALIKKYLEV